MKVTVYPSNPEGVINAIASKSMAHRLLICAALTEGVTRIRCTTSCEDIEATISCLRAMGSNIVKIGNYYLVPKIKVHAGQSVTLDCNESGTTLRFMMCIAAGLGLCARFKGSQRLFERPLSPLEEVLTQHGIVISRDISGRIIQSGRAFGADYTISGDVSSQFISGLLMMLPLCGGKTVTVTGEFESKPYVDLTVSALKKADINVSEDDRKYTVTGRYDMRDCSVEGDWSNASFWLALKAMGAKVEVTGLFEESAQGDKAITELLSRLGGEIDVSNTPDLVPVLAVAAAFKEGETKILGAHRLKLKESDRLESVTEMINAIGGSCEATDDGLIVKGKETLFGGEVDSFNDHRIAMSAAIAAMYCKEAVVIKNAEAVNKSYPAFFEDLKSLGVRIEVEE